MNSKMNINNNYEMIDEEPYTGSNSDFRIMEEVERQRMLDNPEEMNTMRIHGKEVAQLFKAVSRPYFTHANTGFLKYMGNREEKERLRRIEDRDEAVHKRLNALNTSELIRTEGAIIKARLVHVERPAPKTPFITPRTWRNLEYAARVASAVGSLAYTSAMEVAVPAAGVAAGMAATGVGMAANAMGHAYESARSALSGVADRAVHDAKSVEGKVLNTAVDTARSAMSGISSMAGQAIQAEEKIANSATAAISATLSKANAMKDTLVKSVHHAISAPTRADIIELEELERATRILEDNDGCARGNAKKISQMLAYAKFPSLQYSHKGSKWFTKSAEEGERLRRLTNRSECEIQMMNARKVSNIIYQIGWPFIKHTHKAPRSFGQTSILEEEERKRRIHEEDAAFSARYLAKRVSNLVKAATMPESEKRDFIRAHTRKLEDKERKYRSKNCDLALHNAHRQAQLIANIGAPFFIAASTPDVKEIARQKLDRMEAEERFDRTNNADKQALAKKKANKVAKLVSRKTQTVDQKELPTTKHDRQMAQEHAQDIANIIDSDINLSQENERKSRLADKDLANQARANAFKVSGMLKKSIIESNSAHKPFPLSRAHPATISPHCLPVAPCVRATPKQLPSLPATVSVAPVVEAQPLTANITKPVPAQTAEITSPAVPQHAKLIYTVPEAPAQAPIQSAPIQAAPVQLSPIEFAPVQLPPIQAAPVQLAPIQAAPVQVAIPQIITPISQPIISQPIIPQPATSIPYTQTTYNPERSLRQPATSTEFSAALPQRFALKKPSDQSAPMSPEKLIESVRKLYQMEMRLAEKQNEKVARLGARSHGSFGNFRLQRHQASAAKHRENAQRHEQWLLANAPAGMSAR